MSTCPHCTNGQAGVGQDQCTLLIVAYVLAGLAMMLNIRLSYSSAPYALIRFKLPENLFSVFVRRMASALELWCLPSMLLGNIMDYGLKGYYYGRYTQDFGNNGNLKPNEQGTSTIKITIKPKSCTNKLEITFGKDILPNINDTFTPRREKFIWIIIPSIISQWLNFLTYVILLIVYVTGGDHGHLTLFYFVIAISGVVFGINMVLVYAVDWNYIPVYIVGENSFPIVTSFMHYITTLIFGNRRKWNSDFLIVYIDIGVAIIISLVTAVVWTAAYGYYRDTKKQNATYHNAPEVVVDATYPEGTTPVTEDINPNDINSITVNKDGKPTIYNKETSGTTGPIAIKKDRDPTTTTYTNRGDTAPANGAKPNSIILSYKQGDTVGTITISPGTATVHYGHIFTETFDMSSVRWEIISPTLMVIVGMGLVYSIYPGIAPGMIVPFYLIDKIEMVLLIATFFPPVIVAILQRVPETKNYSPKATYVFHGVNNSNNGMGGWRKYASKHEGEPKGSASECDTSDTKDVENWFWHIFDILIVIKISLAIIFIYSLHYRNSNLSRSIVNQPKMSTALSIVFYMCHEFLLALGFPGIIGNNGSTYVVLPAQYVGALFMIFLAFYSEGYIIEYKSYDPAHWPTDGMWYLSAIIFYHIICLLFLPNDFYYDKV
ncbi:Tpr-related protein family member, putative [Theileria annulata]|uniref:Tpr-related protein family member, putative n=1 Tax=Theileria annulata TaxID=5874 RepID=Q4UHZ8_THEAN|nr:Tpr-related protein family member, putative [Theileria annulata]CAI73291.1 Tpr-related protein family member, putative [Theileria annulata]|eukprot:XP_953968.1 Tpr-related protein family member, putative [Theileria annulata]